MYIYMYIYINLPVNTTVRLSYPWSGYSQGQETFLAGPVDNQTDDYIFIVFQFFSFIIVSESKFFIRL